MDYIDFIDSSAIRDHLRMRPPLPPAMQCILIAQSEGDIPLGKVEKRVVRTRLIVRGTTRVLPGDNMTK